MKTAVDREFTPVEFRERVREDLKEFKERYTDGDLLHCFVNATGIIDPYNSKILSCEVVGLPGGTDFNNETRFNVKLITQGFGKFCEVRFFCDMDLVVDTRDLAYSPGRKLYSCDVYRKA